MWRKAPVENIPKTVHYTYFPSFRRDIDLHKLSQNENTSAKKISHLKNSQKGPLKTRSPSSTKISKRKDPEKTIINRNPKKTRSQFQRLCKGIVLTWALATAILSAGQIRRLIDECCIFCGHFLGGGFTPILGEMIEFDYFLTWVATTNLATSGDTPIFTEP